MFVNAYDSRQMIEASGIQVGTPTAAEDNPYAEDVNDKPGQQEFLEKFTVSGPAAFYTYKLACTKKCILLIFHLNTNSISLHVWNFQGGPLTTNLVDQ